MTEQISPLEEIDIMEFSPTNIVTKVLPSIRYHGVRISGFQGIKHFDKDIMAIARVMKRASCLFRGEVDRENLIYTLIPVNEYGQSLRDMVVV